MIETLDYVAEGVARWPEKTRLEKIIRLLTVYLESIQDNEDQLAELLDAFANWYRPGLTFSFVLDIVGHNFIKQPRPAGFGNEDYRLLLIGKTIANNSNATLADIVKLVDYLSRINGGQGNYNVSGGAAEHWTIDIFDVQLTDQWLTLYTRLIFDAIGAVDSFTLSIAGNGVGTYDNEDQLYDEALYD